MTLHTDDAPAKTGKNVLPNSKQHDADVKSHGSLAPPSSTETVHTTQKHPWLTINKGWVQAGGLQVGDHVQQLDGTTATVTALNIIPGNQDMYDLSVSNVHTFAVGSLQFIVHNCGINFKKVTQFFGNNSRNRQYVRLWRATDSYEYQDVAANGYRNFGHTTLKYFAATKEEAMKFGNQALKGKFGLTSGKFPREMLSNSSDIIMQYIHGGPGDANAIREIDIPNHLLGNFRNVVRHRWFF